MAASDNTCEYIWVEGAAHISSINILNINISNINNIINITNNNINIYRDCGGMFQAEAMHQLHRGSVEAS